MNSTLGIVVPVCNAEATLRRQIHDLLEILPDVTENFRVVIVDDASSDSTEEIAYELATTYPQIQVLRHDRVRSRSAAQTGIDHLDSDLVYVHADTRPIRASELHAAIDRAIAGRTAGTIDSHLMQRLMAWGRAVQVAPRAGSAAERPAGQGEQPYAPLRRARTTATVSGPAIR